MDFLPQALNRCDLVVTSLNRTPNPHARLNSRRGALLCLFLLLIGGALVLPLPRISRATVQSTEPEQTKKNKSAESIPGEILVRFRRGAAAAKASTKDSVRAELAVEETGRQISVQIERLGKGPEIVEGLRLARVAPEETSAAIKALNGRGDVMYAEPNYLIHTSAIPNDPHFPEMYALRNTGQNGFPGADISAVQAWDITEGNNSVVIGVVDTGIDIGHSDLKDNIWSNPGEIPDNGIDDDGNGYVDDVNGWDFYNNDKTVFDDPQIDAHGTHVAGTIGAVGNNGTGVVGVSWHVKLMPLKFIGTADGAGPTSGAVAALQYAVMMRRKGINIRAVNASWGSRFFSQTLLDVIKELNTAEILFVTAAGNDGMDNDSFPAYPANYDVPNIISVGAQDQNYQRAPFSNFGERTVHVYAPGVRVLSTTPRNYNQADYTDPDGATYSFFSGTSMAAPQVTGTAALICAAKPDISLTQLRRSILFGSYIVSQLTSKLSTIIHLKASGALQSALKNDVVPPGPVTDLRVSSQVGRRIDLSWTASGDDGNVGQAALYDISFVDSSSGTEIPLLRLTPGPSGVTQQESVNVPYQHTSGAMKIIPFDNAGNQGGATSVSVAVDNIVTNPYTQTLAPTGSISTGGTALKLKGDDKFFANLALPFDFRFFGMPYPAATVSTNGALYFLQPPSGTDAFSTIAGLQNYSMIAGLWDDLRTDRRPDDDVYMVQPDADRVIFRWQAVTVDRPLPGGGTRGENPVSFEIELQRSGAILIRYGEGNANVNPVVGISAGEADAYLTNSHTSPNALISLANAQTIKFDLVPCTYSVVGPASQSVPAGGYSGTTTVNTGPACPWTAASNANWIYVTFGSNSIGSQIVSYDVSPNFSVKPRSGNITVAGQTLAVTQEGISCSYNVGTTVQNFSANGGNSGASVIAPGDCPWTAISNAGWLRIPSSNSGAGNGGINFSVASNVSTTSRSGTISIADRTVTINQDAATVFSTIDDASSFVRQQYLDFLSREPDQGGWDYWTSQITHCGTDALCVHNKRIDVSAAFFIELEFQQTGSVVYRMYRAAYGTMTNAPTRANVTYSQFITDRAQLVGGSGLPQSTIDFANNFVQRPEFKQAYPDVMMPTEFVNKLFDTANLTGPANASLRQQQIDAMTNSAKTRAQVLLDVIEIQEFKDREYNPAFVLMEYFGYLRRDPDQGGYDFWLNVLSNKLPNDPSGYRAMVCAFITSTEYQLRFGTSITRTNRDCSP